MYPFCKKNFKVCRQKFMNRVSFSLNVKHFLSECARSFEQWVPLMGKKQASVLNGMTSMKETSLENCVKYNFIDK
jgi:hypothetical protein